MTDATICLADDALTLQSAAERLPDEALNRACAPFAPAVLEAIEHALLDLSRTCYTIAHSFVPPAEQGEGITDRYLRAAGQWPAARDGQGPSCERQARVLSSLHAAGTALRTAAQDCQRARISLDETMDPMPGLRQLQSRHRAPLVA